MKFDVVIVGASTAGLHAARILSEQGKRVGLFERRSDCTTDRRTLIVTPALGEVLGGIPSPIALHSTGIMRVASENRETEIHLEDPDPIVERAAMTTLFTEQAVTAGAEIFYGCRFKGLQPMSADGVGGVDVLFETSESEDRRSLKTVRMMSVRATQAVLGADGVLSDVAVASGIGRAPCVPLVQAECALPPGWDPGSCKVWFKVNQTKYFYWLIPESDTACVVGLIGEKGLPVRKLLDTFLDGIGLRPHAWQASQVAMHHPRLKPWTSVGKTPLYLIGDAAGQVKVTTVGGTVTGLQGAGAACRAILNQTSYRRELRSTKRELDLHWWIRWALERLDSRGYDHLIGAVSKGATGFLRRHNRDSMVPVFWKLAWLEPRLIPVGIRCLLGFKRAGAKPPKTLQKSVREDV